MSRQNQRYAARLRKLEGILATLPDSQYNHGCFIDTVDVSSCNTVGCAMGHAVASRQFPGLKVRYNGPGLPTGEVFTFGEIDGRSFEPEYDGQCNQRKGMEAWANHYFGPATYRRIFDTDPYTFLRADYIKASVRERLLTAAERFEAA